MFVVGGLQDEQTGPQWPALIGALAKDHHVYATMQNGVHGDSLDPDVLNRWIAFNELYVPKAVPKAPGDGAVADHRRDRRLHRRLGDDAAGPRSEGQDLLDRARGLRVRARLGHRELRQRQLNGWRRSAPGRLLRGLLSVPPASTTARSYFLGAGGALQLAAPSPGTRQLRAGPDAAASDHGRHPGFNAWAAQPNYDWAPVTGTSALGFITAPLTSNMTVVGDASLNVWLSSTAADTDLQVTVSEVRPDGQEFYVTSGFLRASYASTLVKSASSIFDPVYTFASRHDLTPNGAAVEIRVPIDPIAYTFRAGSRLRVTIEAPGGDRPSWAFGTTYAAGTTDTVSLGPVDARAADRGAA